MSAATIGEARNGRIVVEGELSFSSVAEIYKNSRNIFAGYPSIRLDLTGVIRADSAGVALMVEWMRQARLHRTEICFENVPHQLLSMIKVWGLTDIIPIASSSNGV